MPRNHVIQIRFIRRGDLDPDRDDILKITKLGENSLRVLYTEKNEYDSFTDILHINYTQCIAYIYRIATLLTLDEDPFQRVQFFVPGYPTFMVAVGSVKQHTGFILEMISTTLLNWPTIGYAEVTRRSDHSLLPVGGPEETPNATDNSNGTEST